MTALFLSKLISKNLNLIPDYFYVFSLTLRSFQHSPGKSRPISFVLLFELRKQKWQALATFFSKLEDIFGNLPLAGCIHCVYTW